MQGNHTFLSKITACLGITTMSAGSVWFFAAFMQAEKPVLTAYLPVIWITELAVCIVNILILRKERPLWVPAAADIAITAALYGIVNYAVYGDSLKISILIVVCILTGTLMQVYWELRGYSDETLVHISQLILAEAAVQFAAAEYLDIRPVWPMWTTGLALLCLFGALSVKHTGLESSGSDSEKSGRFFPSVGSAVIVFFTAMTALLAAKPVGQAIRWLVNLAAEAVKSVLREIYNVLAWLSDMMKPEMVGGLEDEYGFGNSEQWEEPEYGELDPEMAKLIFILILIAIAAVFLHSIWKLLSKKGRARKTAIKASSEDTGRKEGIILRVKALLQELTISIRTRILLARHPASMAALLMKLEKAVYLNPSLRRKKGETAREFISRLSVQMEKAGNEESAHLLAAFADELDAAFYGRERNILREFSQHKKMLKTLKNSLTTRS